MRLGQFAAMAWKEPLVVLGDIKNSTSALTSTNKTFLTSKAWRDRHLEGRPQVRFNLKYVDVEPYVIPKVSLTGSNADRVDTRVLQVIYSLPDERPLPLYIGQQMDVYLEAVRQKESSSKPTLDGHAAV